MSIASFSDQFAESANQDLAFLYSSLPFQGPTRTNLIH